MDDFEKMKTEWADLMVEQWRISEKIRKEKNLQEKSKLLIHLDEVNNRISELEPKIFTSDEEDVPKCKDCEYAENSISSEPCRLCICGISQFKEKTCKN